MPKRPKQWNVLDEPLIECSCQPITGWYRDGYCATDKEDLGSHVICVKITEDFLAFSKQQGNDLSTPRSEHYFPGLKAGDHWCLCAMRWKAAYQAGAAPKVRLRATNKKALQIVDLATLKSCAIDLN